jgi:hypothetical protein
MLVMSHPDSGLAKSQVELVEKLMKNVDARSIGGALLVAMAVVLVFATIAAFKHIVFAICILVFGLAVMGLIAWLALRLGVGLMDSRHYDAMYERSQPVPVEVTPSSGDPE